MITDAAQRAAALDAEASCIVQAPAGSGKTGLLIQRYLRLLAGVERPEEILAITFTRKAAAEMRRRVLQALDGAAADSPVEDDNQRLTRSLAQAALRRDAQQGWRLRENAARLRIQTIDALCASLARQMPVVSGIGAPPAIVEDARDLFREAAERTLATVEKEDAETAPVRELLRHLDGDWTAARGLLEDMLRRRDHWQHRFTDMGLDEAVRGALEHAFQVERRHVVKRAREAWPPHEANELVALARYAADANDAGKVDLSPLRALPELPAEDEAGAAAWACLADFMLTSSGDFRKRVTKNEGFPTGDAQAKDFKRRMEELLERLCEDDALCKALLAVRRMPPPRFSEDQWIVLGAVVRLLPIATRQLQAVFAERGQIDFTGLAQAAVRALGEPDDPTDLLLAIDVRLRHLLVDEFQDTSLGQWDLLVRLTAGWSPGDGRSVFLVGDPMQSIYRFRQADVGVFLHAHREGLPEVQLQPLRLATNFRSRAGVVDWVNASFRQILAAKDDPEAGAVAYAASVAHHPREETDAVHWHPFVGTEIDRARVLEAKAVVEVCRRALADPRNRTVAILVRSRPHLDRIVPALKRAKIPYRAVEIEPLGRRPVVQDLLALTRALSHLADRVAWLALLHAPWCALPVADLLALTGGEHASDGSRATVWELLHDEARLASLQEDSRARCIRTRDALRSGVEGRLRGSLRERVERAWIALAGPASLDHASDLDDAETFFDQLDKLAEASDIPDAAVLEEKLERLYASAGRSLAGSVQLMTMHAAKGLEFDVVVLPGLDRMPRGSDRPLVSWKARADGRLLIAPVRAAGEKQAPAYDYLRKLEEAAIEHELERLLYVAATRAVRELHLLGYVRREEGRDLRTPPPRSLLSKAWPVARAAFDAAAAMEVRAADVETPSYDDLRRLADAVFAVSVPPIDARVVPLPAREEARIPFSWAGETSRHVGTITHRWLQRIGQEGLDAWPEKRLAQLGDPVRASLARRGVPPAELSDAVTRVMQALRETLADPRGRWILEGHPESRFEYRLRVVRPEGVRLVAIDRVFTDAAGQRWIVDYKTSTHEGGEREAFLAAEVGRYREQLAGYAAALGGAPARLGLYFPLLRAWREVVAAPVDG